MWEKDLPHKHVSLSVRHLDWSIEVSQISILVTVQSVFEEAASGGSGLDDGTCESCLKCPPTALSTNRQQHIMCSSLTMGAGTNQCLSCSELSPGCHSHKEAVSISNQIPRDRLRHPTVTASLTAPSPRSSPSHHTPCL